MNESKRLTDEQLAEIRKRAEAATSGPWIHANDIIYTNVGGFEVEITNINAGLLWDAEFIAHARQDVPDLLAEIERLKSESDYWRMEHDHQRKLSEMYRVKYKRAKERVISGD